MLERFLFLAAILLSSLTGYTQQPDTLFSKLDSLELRGDSGINTDPTAYNKATKLTPRVYFTLLGSNFKQLANTPFHLQRKEWSKVGVFAIVAGGVAAVNRPVNRFAIKLANENKPVAEVSKFVTNFGGLYEVYTLACLYTYGLIFKTEKEKTTTLLASQAYIMAGAVQVVTKFVTGAQRPNYYNSATGKNSYTFHGPFHRFKSNKTGESLGREAYSSFPSGHTTAAFAAATVFAIEYRQKPIIPLLSYSTATLIGLSRLTENKHWATDVLVGAALGYLSGKQVVNNYHRYSKLRQPAKNRGGEVSFNATYFNGHIQPQLTYKF
ncbi:MAG: phosphatase family protein [Segetibacter sp.]|nr:phosphatase family protein [Segetibacter sp.]